MASEHVKTSHDLADELESAARALRNAPAVPLTDASEPLKKSPGRSTSAGSNSLGGRRPELEELVEQLATMERTSAEPELRSLPVTAARRVAKILGLRVPSRATKDETVDLLLAQLFEVPAGQERIRTFHERNRTSSALVGLRTEDNRFPIASEKKRS